VAFGRQSAVADATFLKADHSGRQVHGARSGPFHHLLRTVSRSSR
jgi:hypothetical protein